MDLKKHQNPDGTYDGAGALSELTGISKEEMAEMFDAVMANAKKLASCPRHEFEPGADPFLERTLGRRHSEYVCRRCGGVISSEKYRWYQVGHRDGSGR